MTCYPFPYRRKFHPCTKLMHAVAFLMVSIVATDTVAADRRIADEYEKSIKSAEVVGALGDNVFGEQVNLYTGAVTFHAQDISLPGNGPPVGLGRRYVVESRLGLEQADLAASVGGFSDWELDIPHMATIAGRGIKWEIAGPSATERVKRCSSTYSQPPDAVGWGSDASSTAWTPEEYWHGFNLYIPGAGSKPLLRPIAGVTPVPSAGGPFPWVTGDRWVVSCLPTTAPGNNTLGEGFLVTSPSGDRYWFNWLVVRPISQLISRPMRQGPGARAAETKESPDTPSIAITPTDYLYRDEVRMFPTRVEDRFGNWVTYTYDTTSPWKLLTILANDGRRIDLTYSGNRIASASAHGKTWQYRYGTSPQPWLVEVELPDTTKYTYALGTLVTAYTTQKQPGTTAMCDLPGGVPGTTVYVGSMTHPSGVTGEFSFRSTQHGRSYVPRTCPGYTPPGAFEPVNYAYFPRYFDVIALVKKKLSGPGMTPAEWTYAYGPANASWVSECTTTCPSSKTVTVTDSDGINVLTFGNRYGVNEGKLLSTETRNLQNVVLKTETTTYNFATSGQAYPAIVAEDPDFRSDATSTRQTPDILRQTIQQGRTFTWQVATGCPYGYCFDTLARPTKVVKTSSP